MSKSAEALRQFYETQYPRDLTVATVLRDDDFMYGQILHEIKPYLHPGVRALDLGCGTGGLSLYMARAGCEVLGVDIAANAIEAARRNAAQQGITNARFERTDLQECDATEPFDFVLCCSVIEHIPQDALFLRRIAHALEPGGHLVLTTCTVYSSLYRLSKLLSGHFWFDDQVGHLRRYSREGMVRLVGEAGLSLQKAVFLDSALREWFLLYEPLHRFNAIWGRRRVRTWFNRADLALAKFLFPAAICVHAGLDRLGCW